MPGALATMEDIVKTRDPHFVANVRRTGKVGRAANRLMFADRIHV